MLDWFQISLVSESGPWINMPARAYGSGNFEVETLVDAGRNAAGFMIGSIIGKDKCKVNCKYPPLTTDMAHLVFSAFDHDKNGSFVVWAKFYDIRTSTVVVKKMYVGNRSGNPIKWGNDIYPHSGTLWLGVEANLIEV